MTLKTRIRLRSMFFGIISGTMIGFVHGLSSHFIRGDFSVGFIQPLLWGIGAFFFYNKRFADSSKLKENILYKNEKHGSEEFVQEFEIDFETAVEIVKKYSTFPKWRFYFQSGESGEQEFLMRSGFSFLSMGELIGYMIEDLGNGKIRVSGRSEGIQPLFVHGKNLKKHIQELKFQFYEMEAKSNLVKDLENKSEAVI